MRSLLATSSLLAFLTLTSSLSRAEILLKENDMLAICGDSITNMKPYPAFIADYLLMCQPIPGIHVQQFGISGEKASGLLARMNAAVLPFKPTVVSICYGMNDGGYKEPDPAVTETFRVKETELIQRFKAAGVRTGVLNSPGASDPYYYKRTADYNLTLAGLRDVAKEVAAKEGFAFADLHSLMLGAMASSKKEFGEDDPLAGSDGVHPSRRGHLVMAYGVLKALGCDGAIGTFTVDLGSQSAQAGAGHKILSCANGKVEVESSRYPFCVLEPGSKQAKDKSLVGVLPHLPFNQDLNRFLLIVKNLKGSSAKVTWGEESKVFTKEDLEKGVNLAAEFLSNPFSEPFYKVHEAVKNQQSAWGGTMRKVAHSLIKETDQDKIARTQKEFVEADIKTAREVQALVVPVKHVIKIEPQP